MYFNECVAGVRCPTIFNSWKMCLCCWYRMILRRSEVTRAQSFHPTSYVWWLVLDVIWPLIFPPIKVVVTRSIFFPSGISRMALNCPERREMSANDVGAAENRVIVCIDWYFLIALGFFYAFLAIWRWGRRVHRGQTSEAFSVLFVGFF